MRKDENSQGLGGSVCVPSRRPLGSLNSLTTAGTKESRGKTQRSHTG